MYSCIYGDWRPAD